MSQISARAYNLSSIQISNAKLDNFEVKNVLFNVINKLIPRMTDNALEFDKVSLRRGLTVDWHKFIYNLPKYRLI